MKDAKDRHWGCPSAGRKDKAKVNTRQAGCFLLQRHRYHIVLVLSITLLVYLQVLQNGFVNWDDDLYVYENEHIRAFDRNFLRFLFSFNAGNWHPLTWLSHTVDYAVWNLNPAGHHLMSIFLHLFNTFLVMLLTERLIRRAGSGMDEEKIFSVVGITGLLFGIHPIHVESVAWISERKDVLCAFFFILSLLSYLRYTDSVVTRERSMEKDPFWTHSRYITTFGFFLLSLLSKPMAVTLPAVMLIIDWYPLGRFGDRREAKAAFIEKIPFIALSSASSVVTVLAQHSGGAIANLQDISFANRAFQVLNGPVFYLAKMGFPYKLIPFYPFPPHVSLVSFSLLLSVFILSVITVICFIASRGKKIFAAVWAYYIVTLLPVLGIIHVGKQFMADRYTYLPSIGPFFLFGIGVVMLYHKALVGFGRKQAVKIAFLCFRVILAGVLVYLTSMQIQIWKDGITLWSKVIEAEPGVAHAYNNLGEALLVHGDINGSAAMFEKALAIEPLNEDALNNLALSFLEMGHHEKALSYALLLIQIKPGNESAYNTAGEIYFKRGEYEKAIEYFMKAMKIKDKPLQYFNIAMTLEKLGRRMEACDYWFRYLDRNKANSEVLHHMKEMRCIP